MTLGLGLALQGRLREFLEEEVRATGQAVRQGVKDSTEAVKLGAREEIAQRLSSGQRKGGSNRRVANAIRSRLFDDGPFDQAGLVYSKFGRGRGASFVDYLAPHVLGAEIMPVSRRALLIAFGKTKGTRRKRRNEIQRRAGLAFIRLEEGKGSISTSGTLTSTCTLRARLQTTAQVYCNKAKNLEATRGQPKIHSRALLRSMTCGVYYGADSV